MTPVILTTSQLLTTGVDVPTCKNIVIARVVGSMMEFKQIIGRGTRVRDDYDKYFFNILDYTGSATRLFADPDFDGEPALVTEQEMTEAGETITELVTEETTIAEAEDDGGSTITDDSEGVRRKFYFDGGQVEIAAHLVYELDPDGRQLRVVRFSEYAAEKVRTIYPSAADLRKQWADPALRARSSPNWRSAASTSINCESRATSRSRPFDLLCHLAFNGPLRTRRERADRVKKDGEFLREYGPKRARFTDLWKIRRAWHRSVRHSRCSQSRGNDQIAQLFGGPDGSTSSSRAAGAVICGLKLPPFQRAAM